MKTCVEGRRKPTHPPQTNDPPPFVYLFSFCLVLLSSRGWVPARAPLSGMCVRQRPPVVGVSKAEWRGSKGQPLSSDEGPGVRDPPPFLVVVLVFCCVCRFFSPPHPKTPPPHLSPRCCHQFVFFGIGRGTNLRTPHAASWLRQCRCSDSQIRTRPRTSILDDYTCSSVQESDLPEAVSYSKARHLGRNPLRRPLADGRSRESSPVRHALAFLRSQERKPPPPPPILPPITQRRTV